jgi:hypothetical protein
MPITVEPPPMMRAWSKPVAGELVRSRQCAFRPGHM